MALAAVLIDGHSLASLLSDAVAARGDCDGLLFGCECVQRTTRVTDATDAPEPVEERTVRVTGFVSSGSLCSFYDAAGSFDDAGFARLLRASDGARVVGWFVARRGTPLLPSQRETAVWRALQRRAADGAGPAPLFAIISGEQPEAGEPFSSQFLFLAAPACLPLAVRVLNYGAAAPPRARADAPAAPRWHPLLDGDGDAAASWRALEATAVANAATARSTLEAALGRAALLCQDVERADDVLQARLAELRLQRETALEALEPCHSEVGTSGEELSAADEAEAEAAELLDDAPLVLAQPGPDDPPLAYTPPQLVPDAPAAGEERGTRTMPEDAHTLAWN